jgi:membrane fusion protein (multidrug efflux system)
VITGQATLDSAVAALEKLKTPSTFDVDAARASLAQAEATLAGRRNQYSTQDRQAAEASVAQAQAAVEQQQAALSIQQANLSEAFVTTPFDGVIADRPVTEGSVITANTTLAVLISREVEIALSVEEQAISRLQEGADASFTVSAYPGEQFRGLVTSVFPTGDARSRTFTVKVRPEDTSGRLRPGMFAQISVVLERRENVPVVPREAIVLRNDRPFVFTVADGAAALRQLELGLSEDRRAEVKTGVQVGEDVVISGQATLRDKDAVRIVPAGGQRAGGGSTGGAGGAPGGQAGGQQGAPAGGAGAQGQGQAPRPAGTPSAAAQSQGQTQRP